MKRLTRKLTPKTKTKAKAAAVILALAGAFVFVRAKAESPRPPPAVVSAGPKVDWPVGKELTYALDWHTTTESRGATAFVDSTEKAESLKSGVDVVGELVLTSYGKTGDGTFLVRARFEHLSKASVSAFDQPLLPNLDTARHELEGHSAELSIESGGRVANAAFQSKDPALFRYLMQAVVAELNMSSGAGTKIEGPSGSGSASFRPDPNDAMAIVRTRERYDTLSAWPEGATPLNQDLKSAGKIKLDRSGVIERIADDETLEASRTNGTAKDVRAKTSFVLTKRSERTFDASIPPPALVDPRPAFDSPEDGESETARRDRLERRTRGVTVDTVLDEVHIHAAVPKGKNGRWAWVAQGYLELHPEKCGELIEKMRSGLDYTGKGFVLDLLVMTGHAEAQAAIVRALSDPNLVEQKHDYPMLAQRIGRLQSPTKETAAWFAKRYATAKAAGDLAARRGTAIALGGLIHGVAERDRSEARALDDALVLDLHATKNAIDREFLLKAIGNAGLEEDELAIRLYAHDDVADVRQAVASGLRRFDSPLVRSTLLGLLRDSDTMVSHLAIDSLDRRTLSAADLISIAEWVRSEHFEASHGHELVTLMATRRKNGLPEVVEVLATLAAQPSVSAEARQRALYVIDNP